VEQWQDKVFSDPQRIWTPEELVRFGIADSPAFVPGTEFQYSNTNTALLGLVLEQVSGKPNGDLYREGIIEPLGLLETSFPNTDPSLPDPHAQGYTLQCQDDGEVGNATDRTPSWGWTAGGMISTVEDLLVFPEQVSGALPQRISLDEADGNSVILDIGGGNYVFYGHFQPGSIRVKKGDRVRRGDVLALVGNSGNSSAPHLHFHVMNGPLSFSSNGLPYVVDSFTVTGRNTAGTEAFDEAEGTPLKITPADPVETVTQVMPLDQYVVSFD
jgi:hypothetical protein